MEDINIKQFAAKLNVSTSTISRAFRGHSDINQQTKEHILAMAQKLNYQPNHLASNMREKKSKTIAVIVPEIANDFFSQAIHGIEGVARDKGYHLLIYVTDDVYEKEVAYVNHLYGGRADGVIMSVSGEANDHKYLKKIKTKKMPLVFFDRIYEDIETAKITTNDYESSFVATEHLILGGCKKIAYLVINKNISIGNKRMNGYLDALEKYHVPFNEEYILDCSNDYYMNDLILKQAFTSLKPDGVFASVERLAFASYYVAYELGIKIPEDMKIISFSSLEIAGLLNPSLSTITQPAFEMGVKAANILFKNMESGLNFTEEDNIVLNSVLVERKSSES
jgi:LacI family transcriptional regulator